MSLSPFHMTISITPPYVGLTYIQGSLNKFPDFFHRGTFINSTHMKL